jgi:hypothetical protein
MTREQRQQLRDVALRASRATGEAVWELQTSNSFRRIGTVATPGHHGGDGDVLCAITQRGDNCPDLLARSGVLDHVVAAQPRVVLALLGQLDEAEAVVAQLRDQLESRR